MPSTSIPIKLGEPVIFDYEELLKASSADSSSEQLYAKMKAAFGPESLGLCVVRGVPVRI